MLAAIPDLPATRRIREKAHHLLFVLFSLTPDLSQCCFQLLLTAAASSPSPLAPYMYLVPLSLVIVYHTQNKGGGGSGFLSDKYVEVLNLFSTHVLGSRVRPDHMVVGNCAGIFKKVTHQLFKEYLLQPLLKALLRNPDELTKSEFGSAYRHSQVDNVSCAVVAVTFVVSSVPIDLSSYAGEILEKCVSQLSSSQQRAETRQDTQDLVCALCKQCSDNSSAIGLFSQLSLALKSTASKL